MDNNHVIWKVTKETQGDLIYPIINQ